jgi:N-acetylmuramoyl-L-alanine amidase CwlA
MELKKCIFTHSGCYLWGEKMTNSKPLGIVVHSTGANNKNLKRYVQPIKGDTNYNEVINDIGKNSYNNHWHKEGKKACVHAFIGVNKANEVETYQVLPWDNCCWGIGKGKKGSYNYNPTACIQFEICEDNLKDEAYFNEAMNEAQELCAFLCKEFNLTESDVRSHAEAYKEGYGTNHGDCDHWLKKFGKDMKWFRGEVKSILDGKNKNDEPFKPYKVKVTTSALNIRKGAGTNYKKVGSIKDKGVYTIVDEAFGEGANLWGKLKSGAGWISLDYCKKL